MFVLERYVNGFKRSKLVATTPAYPSVPWGGGGGACLTLILCFIFPFLAFYFFFTNLLIFIILIFLYLLFAYFLLYISNIIFKLKEAIEDNTVPDNEIPKYTKVEKVIQPVINAFNKIEKTRIRIENICIMNQNMFNKNKQNLIPEPSMHPNKETIKHK